MAPTEAADEGEEEAERDGPDKDGWLDLMNGAIRKRVLSQGAGEQPEMKMDVICSYEVRLASGSSEEVLQRRDRTRYRIGEGEAVPCLELGLRNMRPGEEAEIFGASRLAWGPGGLPSDGKGEREVPADADVVLRVVLHECLEGETAEPTWNRKVQEIAWRKANGNDHYRRKQFQKAARSYGFGLDVFQGSYEPPEEVANGEAAVAAAMSYAADIGSNLAAVHLELGNAVAAREAATAVLQMNPDHIKCLYRVAKACFLLDEFEECEAALQRVLGLDPENAAVRRLEAEFKRKKQRYVDKSKRVAANILSGLDYPEQTPAAGLEAQRDSEPGALRTAITWSLDRWRYIAAAAVVWLLAALLCLVLPKRAWPYCIMAPMIGFPVAIGLAASRGEDPKKKS